MHSCLKAIMTMLALLTLGTGVSASWFDLSDTVNTQGDRLTNFPVSSRSAVLGTADLTDSNGTEALYLNPAGLSAGWQADVQATYVNLAENTRYHFLGFHFPINERLALGWGWGQLASMGFEARDDSDNYLGRFNHLSNNVALGMGLKLSPFLRIGATLKYLDQELASYHENSLALDAGMIVEGEHWGAALALQNAVGYAGDPYWGIRGVGQVPADIMDFNARLGGHWNPGFDNPWFSGLDFYFSLEALKLQDSLNSANGFWRHWNAGLEYTLPDLPFKLRAGASPQHLAAGVGTRFQAWQLDYSIDLRAAQTLHWLSLKWEVPLQDNTHTLQQIDHKFDQAVKAYQAGDYSLAMKQSRDILLLDPDQEQAKLLYWKSQRDVRHQLDNLLLKAKAYVSIKAFDDAFETLKQSSAMAMTNQEYLMAIDRVRFYAQEEQQIDIARIIKTHQDQALAQEQNGNWVDALQQWEELLIIDPENQTALTHIQDITKRIQGRLDGYFAEAVKAMQRFDYWQAVKLFNTILKLSPGYSSALVLKQQCQAAMSKDMDRLYSDMVQSYKARNFSKALTLGKRLKAVSPHYRNLDNYLPLITRDYNRIKSSDGAIRMIDSLVTKHRLSQALSLLTLLDQKNALNQKLMALKVSLKQRLAKAALLRERGVQAYQKKELDICIDYFRQSLAIDQDNRIQDLIIQAYISAGVLNYRRDALDKAIAYWEAARQMDQENNLIQTYLKRAQNKKANLVKWK